MHYCSVGEINVDSTQRDLRAGIKLRDTGNNANMGMEIKKWERPRQRGLLPATERTPTSLFAFFYLTANRCDDPTVAEKAAEGFERDEDVLDERYDVCGGAACAL